MRGPPFHRSPLFGCGIQRSQRLQLRVEGAFQQSVETTLMLAFANSILLVHLLTHSAVKGLSRKTFETITSVGRRGGSSQDAAGFEHRCVANDVTPVVKVGDRFKGGNGGKMVETRAEMHELRSLRMNYGSVAA